MHFEIPKVCTLIRGARIDRKLSQDGLAKEIGTTRRTISAIETDSRYPPYDMFYKLVQFLGLPTERIFWPQKASCTPEQERLIRAMQTCSEYEQMVLMDIGWAYIQAVSRKKSAKKADGD